MSIMFQLFLRMPTLQITQASLLALDTAFNSWLLSVAVERPGLIQWLRGGEEPQQPMITRPEASMADQVAHAALKPVLSALSITDTQVRYV